MINDSLWKDTLDFYRDPKNRSRERARIAAFLKVDYDEKTSTVCPDCGKKSKKKDLRRYVDNTGANDVCNTCYQSYIEAEARVAIQAETARQAEPLVSLSDEPEKKQEKLKEVKIIKAKRRIEL